MNELIFLLSVSAKMSQTPIWLAIILLIVSMLMFFSLGVGTGLSWVALMLSLLFTGGVLIVLIIIATFHQKSSSASEFKSSKTIFLASVMSALTLSPLSSGANQIKEWGSVKEVFQQASSIATFTILISFYFYVFLQVAKAKNTGMRVISCQE